jgi:polysaccharide pyruvyl transferase WcaK-like protein
VADWSVLGWYGHHNVGDEAYRLAFPRLFPGPALSFTDSVPADRHDMLVLGGGDVLTAPMLDMAARSRSPRAAMSVSATSCNDPRRVAAMFDHVWVRDARSQHALEQGGVDARLVPDFAFALEADAARGRGLLDAAFAASGADRYDRVVAVVVNAHLAVREGCLARDEAWFVSFAHMFGWMTDRVGASFLFVPFGTASPWDDRVANGWVASRSKFWQKNVVVYSQPSPQDALDLLSACDAAVTSRLHAAIFCTIGGVPFVDLSHHDKTTDYLATAGLGDYAVPYWDCSRSFLLGQLEQRLSGGAEESARLAGVARRFRAALADACGAFTCTPA